MISQYVWDRGCYSVLYRTVRRFHTYEVGQSEAVDSELQGLLDFVTTRADVMHDCGTAFHWGLKPVRSPDVMRDLYISIAAIRNSYSILMANLPNWLPSALMFVDACGLGSEENLRRLWGALGVGGEILERLVSFRLLFLQIRLVVRADLRETPGFLDDLFTTLMGVWRFVTFSESRWLSLGVSCRA